MKRDPIKSNNPNKPLTVGRIGLAVGLIVGRVGLAVGSEVDKVGESVGVSVMVFRFIRVIIVIMVIRIIRFVTFCRVIRVIKFTVSLHAKWVISVIMGIMVNRVRVIRVTTRSLSAQCYET
jgi:hypothetical protein